jgi:hypothetical protein
MMKRLILMTCGCSSDSRWGLYVASALSSHSELSAANVHGYGMSIAAVSPGSSVIWLFW